jgi:ribosomal protein L29
MALLRAKDIHKMNKEDRKEKLREIRFELVKAGVTANKAKAKTKELKRALSRLLTISREVLKK